MSTSPDQPHGKPNPSWEQPLPDARQAALIILKKTGWLALIVAVFTAIGMNYELIWNLLSEAVPLILEVIEDALDTFFEKVVRLNPAFAQIATAYFGFVLALVLLYFIVRKSMNWWKRGSAAYSNWKGVYVGAWKDGWAVLETRFLHWWVSLDMLNKAIAVVAFVLIGIPIALLLSIMLGSLVADLLL